MTATSKLVLVAYYAKTLYLLPHSRHRHQLQLARGDESSLATFPSSSRRRVLYIYRALAVSTRFTVLG